ncbi:Uncharacterised protein [Raoultella ornithinolytica]|nr:Uncharacterised protein [Raoultella ornithinolytica]
MLGEVVAVHIDESLLENGVYQTAKARPILRAGGPSAYYTIDENLRFRPDPPGRPLSRLFFRPTHGARPVGPPFMQKRCCLSSIFYPVYPAVKA